MVCAVESSNWDVEGLNIKDYILENYVPANASECNYTIEFVDDVAEPRRSDKHAQLRCSNLIWPFSRCGNSPTEVPIKAAQLLTKANDERNPKRIIELTIAMEYATDSYQPGDTIAILPSNDTKEIYKLLNHMQLSEKSDNIFQLQLSSKCTKKTLKVPDYIPLYCTPYLLLRDCLNIHAIPKKQFLSALANSCTNAAECAFLKCLSSKEGSGFYSKLVLDLGLTLCELLILCPSCKPTLVQLVEHLPRLLPRPYSIANNPISNEVKIIFSIRSQKPGVTTNMLSTLALRMLNDINVVDLPKIIAFGRQTNQFRFTAKEAGEHNHILIGVGTAISPFLGFLELKTQMIADNTIKSFGKIWLFAGATTERSLPHRERILAYKESNVLQHYFECLSRAPDASYLYIQDQISALGSEFVEFLMQENTVLYTCADGGKISQSIDKAIIECLAQVQKITWDEAKEVTKSLKRNGKYREDVWL
ncbi:methionine synthase reductase [Eurosta solidaginis]|uniref:methionine synthase reductase n=1 Tax=Eurosta solidaginis TaxID=178769 RepID=UPI0035309E94